MRSSTGSAKKKMLEFQKSESGDNAMVSMDRMHFLKKWLIEHIEGTDDTCQACFKANHVV